MSKTLRTAAVFAAAFLFGCRKNVEVPEAVPSVHAGPAVAADEGTRFGADLERAVAAKDSAGCERLFSSRELAARCVSDLGVPQAVIDRLRGPTIPLLTDEMIKTVAKGGEYKFLRVRTVGGRLRALFRLTGDDGLTYHEFVLARFPGGRIAAEDVYVATTGEMLSVTCRRYALPLVRDANRGLADRLLGGEREYLDNAPKVAALIEAARTGAGAAAAYAGYRSLPEGLKRDKFVHIHAVMVAAKIGDREYLAELESFLANNPGDPACDLVGIDCHLAKKRFDEAAAALGRLNTWAGGDPYLNARAAVVLTYAGKYKEAEREIAVAATIEPKSAGTLTARLTLACWQHDHPATLKWLKALAADARHPVRPAEMEKDCLFEDFVRQPQYKVYKKWLADRG